MHAFSQSIHASTMHVRYLSLTSVEMNVHQNAQVQNMACKEKGILYLEFLFSGCCCCCSGVTDS